MLRNPATRASPARLARRWAATSRKAEETSVPITLILLLVVFGSLIAGGIPLLLALTAVIAAISLLSVVGQWLPVGSSTSEVVLIIGMAVGIDYSLFYLRREREERARGRSFAEALRIAAGTSGKAIVISGLTVMVALAGLFLTGLSVFDGVAFGSIAVVGIAVAGSLTVLPALLSWLGPRADRGRIPVLRRRAGARPSRLWAVLVRRVVRHPLAWGGVAAVAMLALAAPALGMRIGYPAIDAPKNLAVVQTMDSIERAFPQGPSPAQVVVTGQDLGGPAVARAVAVLQGRASASGPVRAPVTVASVAGGHGLVVSVPLAGNGSGSASDSALVTLRNQILPSTLGKVPGLSYSVTGDTASNHDFTQQLHSRVPLVFAMVAGVAFVLLAVAFGSIAIPLVSILLNLLSVGAAYGLITLIFQDGRLQGPLGYTSFGGIIAWEPLFMFVFLFGISMDYHVFLLSRIRELRSRGSTDEGGRGWRYRVQRRGGDQRRIHHGGGVLGLRDAVADRPEDPRHRHGRCRADRRHHSPRHPAPRSPRPARRPDLGGTPLAASARGDHRLILSSSCDQGISDGRAVVQHGPPGAFLIWRRLGTG